MLHFSEWLVISEAPIPPQAGSSFTPVRKPAPTPTNTADPPLNKGDLNVAAYNFILFLKEKIRTMIGKSLNAYQNKGSDSYARAAITLKKYEEKLIFDYQNWIENLVSKVLDNNKTPSPPPSFGLNEAEQKRYSLGDYAKEMYKVAIKTWENWLVSPYFERAKKFLAAKSGYKNLPIKVPEYKKVARNRDGSLNLNHFVDFIINSTLGKRYMESSQMEQDLLKIDHMSTDEYENLLTKYKSQLKNKVLTKENLEKLMQNSKERDALIQKQGALSKGGKFADTLSLGVGIGSGLTSVSAAVLFAATNAIGIAGFGLFSGVLATAAFAYNGINKLKKIKQKDKLGKQWLNKKSEEEDQQRELKAQASKDFLQDLNDIIKALGNQIAIDYTRNLPVK